MKVYAEQKLQEDINIPFSNKTVRRKKMWDYYNDEKTIVGIENFYSRDIKKFGYERPF
mgnify:FL=1